MIALQIIRLRWADPNSRKVLVHDDTEPVERFLGEDGDGFDNARWAVSERFPSHKLWRYDLCALVAPSDMPLYCVATTGKNEWHAVYIEHFSSPTDYSDHFVETPLLVVPEDAPEPDYDHITHKWSIGDWFVVTEILANDDRFCSKYGRGPFYVANIDEDGDLITVPFEGYEDGRFFLPSQIRPCPDPGTSFGDYDPALLDPFAIDTNPIHCPVCSAEMVMDYDGGELVCSSDDCDARQPLNTPSSPSPKFTSQGNNIEN